MEPIDGWNLEDIELTSLQAWIALGIYVVIVVVFLMAYISIIRKAGYSGWWILTAFIPVLNVVMFLLFAFREWPVERRLRSALMGASVANPRDRETGVTWT